MPKFPSAANVASVVRKYDGVKFANNENQSATDMSSVDVSSKL